MPDFVLGLPLFIHFRWQLYCAGYTCRYISVCICISWHIYIPSHIGSYSTHTHRSLSETSNSFGAQTCKLVLCHLRVLHSSIALALPCLFLLLPSSPYLLHSPSLNNVCDARSMRPLPKLAQCLSESISQACN